MPEKERGKTITNGKNRKTRILLVDDDKMLRESMVRFLNREGCQVLAATEGKTALDIFRSGSVDIILSDIETPGLDGLSLLKEVKKTDASFPVVLISSSGDVRTVMDALNAGADNFLQKPVRLNELRRVLERVRKVQSIPGYRGDFSTLKEQESHFEAPSRQDKVNDLVFLIARSAVMVGFAAEDLDNNLKLALVEIITNAMEHGNRWDPDKTVTVQARLTKNRLSVSVSDLGPGFDHADLPDPTVEENLFNERGRGVFLARAMMDEVRYNEAGNQVTLIKTRP